MIRWILAAVMVAALALAGLGAAIAASDAHANPPYKTIVLCWNGETIEVPLWKWKRGDYPGATEGPCEPTTTEPPPTTTEPPPPTTTEPPPPTTTEPPPPTTTEPPPPTTTGPPPGGGTTGGSSPPPSGVCTGGPDDADCLPHTGGPERAFAAIPAAAMLAAGLAILAAASMLLFAPGTVRRGWSWAKGLVR